MDLTRRHFLYSSLGLIPVLIKPQTVSAEVGWYHKMQAHDKSKKFVDQFVGIQSLDSIVIDYELYMKCEFLITLKTMGTLKLERDGSGNYFRSQAKISEPVPHTIMSHIFWEKIKNSEEFQEMQKAISVTLEESIFFDDKFYTDYFEEILPIDKEYDNQIAQKVKFDYKNKRVLFWEDKEREVTETLDYTDQVCAQTAFWNYLLFGCPKKGINIINTIKQRTIDTEEVIVNNNFCTEHIDFKEYKSYLYLNYSGENLLDVIDGQIKYKQEGLLPYFFHIDGIISKRKKILGKKDCIAAKDVRAYLKNFNITHSTEKYVQQ